MNRKLGLRSLALGVASVFALGVACSDEDAPSAAQCVAALGDGAVAGTPEPHCRNADGSPIVQSIGECVSGAEAQGEEHEHDESADAGSEEEPEGEHADAGAHEEHEHDEEHAINIGREADDDDCKYRVSFTNTCVAVNQPVTFTLSLTRKVDGMPGSGTNPAFPEVYLADDPSHISPSNDITASEGPAGTYEIGPILFDQSGRWVIRFHYFDTCSEIPADSPHGHAAFYIDVP
jgi:hypothetical protein